MGASRGCRSSRFKGAARCAKSQQDFMNEEYKKRMKGSGGRPGNGEGICRGTIAFGHNGLALLSICSRPKPVLSCLRSEWNCKDKVDALHYFSARYMYMYLPTQVNANLNGKAII